MSQTPDDRYYAATHEWVKVDEGSGIATVGISDYAQGELGDVVYVELPKAGRKVSVGDEVSVVESVKTASDLYAPLSGEIVAVNERLEDNPEILNTSPYEDGWIFRIKYSDEGELDALLKAQAYVANHTG